MEPDGGLSALCCSLDDEDLSAVTVRCLLSLSAVEVRELDDPVLRIVVEEATVVW